MQRLSDEQLAELRGIAEAATPGPWEADGNEVSQHWSRPEPWEEIASSEVVCMAYCYGGSARGIDREEDAEHIAAFDPPTVLALLDELAAYRAREADPVTGDTSDGYHTFNELYEYRMLYNAHAAHGWLAAGIPVVKSWRHSDGEECFGGGWFIVTADLPAGQVSNHYEAKHWGLFKVPEVETAPVWDGHTPQDAARRLRIEAEHARKPSEAVSDDD